MDRYTPSTTWSREYLGMEADPEGEWVRYKDVEKELNACAAIAKDIADDCWVGENDYLAAMEIYEAITAKSKELNLK